MIPGQQVLPGTVIWMSVLMRSVKYKFTASIAEVFLLCQASAEVIAVRDGFVQIRVVLPVQVSLCDSPLRVLRSPAS